MVKSYCPKDIRLYIESIRFSIVALFTAVRLKYENKKYAQNIQFDSYQKDAGFTRPSLYTTI